MSTDLTDVQRTIAATLLQKNVDPGSVLDIAEAITDALTADLMNVQPLVMEAATRNPAAVFSLLHSQIDSLFRDRFEPPAE